MEVANIYDNGPISPVARIKDNLGIWSENKWLWYQIAFIEPVPRSSPFMVDMVAASGAVTFAAYGTIAKQNIPALLMNDLEMLHLRWEPLDDVEGMLWELSGQSRFSPRGGHARVSLFTGLMDPYLATTTFYIIGKDKEMMLEVRNPNPVALPMARFVFFGYRYILEKLAKEPDLKTLLPAQGR